MSELAKCPFCVKENPIRYTSYQGGPRMEWASYISCGCGIRTRDEWSMSKEQAEASAIAAWNRRAIPECPEIQWEYSEGKDRWAAHLGLICIGNAFEDTPGGTAIYRAFAPNSEGKSGRLENLAAAKAEVEGYGRETWNRIHGVGK